MAEREYREIVAEDVGKSTFSAFGRQWPVSDFIGRIFPEDIGKRVYRSGNNVVSVENNAQFRARREAEVWSRGSNAERLAHFICGALSGAKGVGIDLVRPPNPAYGHAVAVLFADGRDVVIRFEEQGGK